MAFKHPRRGIGRRLLAGCLSVASMAILASSPVVLADSPDRSTAERGDEFVSDISFLCAPERSSLILSEDMVDAKGYERRSVDLGALILYGKEDGQGIVRRTDTKSISSECGALTVLIQGAFYNANPQGELGAADDYAVVTIRQDGNLLLGPVALGQCSKGNPRYDTFVECPGSWATRVTVHGRSDGSYAVDLQRAYDEWMLVTP